MRSKRERKQKGSAHKVKKGLAGDNDSFATEDASRCDLLTSRCIDCNMTGIQQSSHASVMIQSRADSNAVLLQPRQQAPAAEEGGGDSQPAKKLSKAQKRKWQKVQEEKAKRAERAQVLIG